MTCFLVCHMETVLKNERDLLRNSGKPTGQDSYGEEITFLIVQKHHCHFTLMVSSAILLCRGQSRFFVCCVLLVLVDDWQNLSCQAGEDGCQLTNQPFRIRNAVVDTPRAISPGHYLLWHAFENSLSHYYIISKKWWLGICEREGRENIDGERLKF